MQYSPLRSSDSLCCAEEGRHDISSGESHDQLRRRQKPWILLIALSAIVFFMAGAGMFGPGLLSLERRILLRLSIQLPPPPGNATKMYKPEKCIPTKVPVPRVEDMTLDEKLGQMTQVDQLAVGSGEDITNYFIGSVLSGGGGAPAWGNSAEAWADLVDNMAAKASKTRLRIPMLYGVDAVHGHNNVDGATIFPHHVGLGATRNPGLVKKIAAAAAKEVAATGIRWAFAPTIAVCRDPRWGRCYESFSEETDLVRNLTSEIDGWQTAATSPGDPASMVPGEYLVAATAKHFVGDGGTYGGKDEGDTRVSEAELREVHLPPFRDAVRRGVLTTMISYSSWNGLKMHANGYLITDVLKGELGFKGVVVSDWAAIQQIPCNWACQIRTAINAGLDMIMVPTTYQAFIGALRSEVLQGNVAMDRIDDAVRRVLRLKVQLGLFENACAQRSLIPEIGSGPHRELARKAARETLVLLKNERRPESAVPGSAGAGSSMFPLPLDGARVLVAGSHADDVGKQCGGWTIKWQGGVGNITNGTTVLQGVQRAAAGRAHVQYVEQPTGEESADYGIVVVGELPYTEYYGDNQNLQLSARSQAAVTAVCGRMPCVVVLISGRVMEVDHLVAGMDAFVAAWLPGSEAGQGIADALFSPQFDFVGRLPFTWFPDPATNRISANKLEESTPLFPFGFGLNKLGQALPSL